MDLTLRQLHIVEVAMMRQRESYMARGHKDPLSVRAIAIAECNVVLGAVREEKGRLKSGAQSESDHQGSEEH